MADVQIAVIDQQNTQLALAAPEETHVNVAVPGVQGAKGDTGTVAAAGDGTAAAPGISFANDLNTGIYRPGNDQLAITTNGTQKILVSSAGNVGFGTSTSLGARIDANTTGTDSCVIRARNDSTSVYLDANNGYAYLNCFSNHSLLFGTNNTERMRLDSSGRLGLGTSAPWTLQAIKFDQPGFGVAGNIATARQLSVGAGTDYQLALGYYQTGNAQPFAGVLQALDNGNGTILSFNPSGGNVGIGTVNPGAVLQVAGSSTVSSQANVAAKVGAAITSDLLLGSLNGNSPFVASQGAYPLLFNTNAQERMRIDSSGRLLVGTSTYSGSGTGFEIEGTGLFGPQIRATAKGSDQFPTYVVLRKARGSSIVQNGDFVFELKGEGYDGNAYISAASIRAEVDGTPGTNDMPGRLVFSTTADGASSTTERMRIDSAGRVGIGTASPGTTLDVNGKLRLSSTEDNQLEWVSGAQTWRSNAVSGGKWYLYDATNTKFPLDVAANTTCKLDINTSHVAFTTNNSERVRIDSLGKLLKGLSSSVATLSGLGAELQINEGSGVAFSLHRSTADANGANIVFRKTRGTSPSDVTAVATADVLGYITWMGTDGTNPISAASIIAQVDGTPGTNDMPGRLVFSTTADGASSPTERMRIKSTGIVNVGNTPVYADNAAAKTGGLVDGDIYRTSTGDLKIVYT